MNESSIFSLKIIIHAAHFSFSYLPLSFQPLLLFKILNFPIILIKSSRLVENKIKMLHPEEIFQQGKSLVFKYEEETLKEKLQQNPTGMFLLDEKEEKTLGQTKMDMTIFSKQIRKLANEEEDFKRHSFKAYDEKMNIVAIIDLSISLVKRGMTYISKQVTARLDQLNIEKEKENNFSKRSAAFGIIKRNVNMQNSQEYQKIDGFTNTFGRAEAPNQVRIASPINIIESDALEFNQEDIEVTKRTLPIKKDERSLQATFNDTLFRIPASRPPLPPPPPPPIADPSLKVMVEGYFCPPMMFLKNKPEPSTTYFPSCSPCLRNEGKKNAFPLSGGMKSPDFRATLQELLPDRYTREEEEKKDCWLVDQLINELLALKNQKLLLQKNQISTEKDDRNEKKINYSPPKENEIDRKPYEYMQKSTIRPPPGPPVVQLEKERIKTEEYSEDFESVSQDSKQQIGSNSKSFERRIGETVNSEEYESILLSKEQRRGSWGSPKMTNCYLCKISLETNKLAGHLKECKKESAAKLLSSKRSKENVSASIHSIEEESDLAGKVVRTINSSPHEEIEEDHYASDFNSLSEASIVSSA